MPVDKKTHVCLTVACLAILCQTAKAGDLTSQAMIFFKQSKYVEAAGTFAKSYATTHRASDCYYTALSYHYAGNSELARKFYQETIQTFPTTREASMAQQALAVSRPITKAKLGGQSGSRSDSYASQPSSSTPASNSVDDLLSKAASADQANQPSTADGYYSDAIRDAEKLGQTNPKLIEALEASATYFARHQRTDKALAAYDRERNLLKIRYGQDSVQYGNNLLAIARMFKTVDNVEDAKTHYYSAIDTFTNALQEAENKQGSNAGPPRALLSSTLEELADYLYNLVFSARGYGNVEIKSQHITDTEVSRLRARAERVRAGN